MQEGIFENMTENIAEKTLKEVTGNRVSEHIKKYLVNSFMTKAVIM